MLVARQNVDAKVHATYANMQQPSWNYLSRADNARLSPGDFLIATATPAKTCTRVRRTYKQPPRRLPLGGSCSKATVGFLHQQDVTLRRVATKEPGSHMPPQ